MGAWWYSIKTTYDLVSGTGKYWTIFILALFVIYFLESDLKKRRMVLYPSLLLCIFTITPFVKIPMYYVPILPVIAYAFVIVWKQAKTKWVTVMMIGASVLMILMGGHFFFGSDHLSKAWTSNKIPAEYQQVYDSLQSLDDSPKAVLPPKLAIYARGYNSSIRLLYAYPDNGDVSLLGEEIGKVYEQLSGHHPDSEYISNIARNNGCQYIIYDRENHYAQFPLQNYGFLLVDSIGQYDIYQDEKVSQ